MAATAAIIAGAVALIGSASQSISGRKAAATQRRALRDAAHELGTKRITKRTKKLLPQMRELIAGGLGQQMQSAVETNIARRGLTGTGLGVALKDAAAAIPEVEAFRQALTLARDISFGKAGIKAGGAAIGGAPSPWGGALQAGVEAGANAFIGAGGLNTSNQVAVPAGPPVTSSLSPGAADFLIANPVPTFTSRSR